MRVTSFGPASSRWIRTLRLSRKDTDTKTNAALDGEWKCADTPASAYYIHQSGKFGRRQDFLMLALFASDERWWFVHNGTDTKINTGLLAVRILFSDHNFDLYFSAVRLCHISKKLREIWNKNHKKHCQHWTLFFSMQWTRSVMYESIISSDRVDARKPE